MCVLLLSYLRDVRRDPRRAESSWVLRQPLVRPARQFDARAHICSLGVRARLGVGRLRERLGSSGLSSDLLEGPFRTSCPAGLLVCSICWVECRLVVPVCCGRTSSGVVPCAPHDRACSVVPPDGGTHPETRASCIVGLVGRLAGPPRCSRFCLAQGERRLSSSSCVGSGKAPGSPPCLVRVGFVVCPLSPLGQFVHRLLVASLAVALAHDGLVLGVVR